ncbi:MAG: glucose 1-dehydrogenase [Chloroflexi bacterium]|nr:glucose 1-dehydrogenase [Chloroflexota bacterium]
MLEKLNLDGCVAIVTGGGTGLGREMVRHLARAGADLVIAARRTGPIEAVAAEVRELGRRALAISTDVTDAAQVNRMVEQTLREFGRIDVLISNAGIAREQRPKPIWEITDQEWRQGIDVNLTGSFYCARAVARPMMDAGRGVIINVASGFGLRGQRDGYMYSTAKGGVIQLTRTLAMSFGRNGIRSNCIVPGFIPTEGTVDQRQYLPRGDFIPVGRVGNPPEVGPIAVFLASDASAYMNGEVIVVDGGGLAGGYAPTGYAPLIPLKEAE